MTTSNSFPLSVFQDLYSKPTLEQQNHLELLKDHLLDCDQHVTLYLNTNIKFVALIRIFLTEYFDKNPTTSANNFPNQQTVDKHASTVAMSLAETGALDDEMLTTKNIIANVISPI